MPGAGKSRAEVQLDERYRVRSVERALDVLDVLVDAGQAGLRLTELAQQLEISKSTALALLRTLVSRGFVAEIGSGRVRRYTLGLALARLGDLVLSQIEILDLALPSLREMTDETGWTSRIGLLDDGYAVIIGRVDGPGVVRFRSNLARRELPHCSAIGKSLLSHLPEPEIRAIVTRTGLPARTPATITDMDQLLRELEKVSEQGFAVDDEEDSVGVVCVGSAVYDHRGECTAAISLTGLKLNLPAGGIEGLGTVVRRCGDEISRRLGATPVRTT